MIHRIWLFLLIHFTDKFFNVSYLLLVDCFLYLFIYLFIYLFVYVYTYLFIYLFIYLSIYILIYFLYLHKINTITHLQFVKNERLPYHRNKIVRLIKAKSKVNANVTKTLSEIYLIFFLYLQ